MTVQSSNKDDLFNLDLIRSYVDKELNPRFVERHWLKQQVEDKLADPDCRFLLLTAEPGAGKSALMAWLANQHPDWCRYFIRRDQRTPLGDVGSYSFLLQVGFQLAATYPGLFKQDQIKIVVEQRIGTATNSEIVGAEIGKIFASPFYEKVIQIQQQVTHSKDTSTTGVRIGEFYAAERDLPIENLQFMALFDPAKAMLKQMQEAVDQPQQQIVVLVDALDELRYQDSQLSLLKWLTNCPELPANLRFVLTCRPDDDLLRVFRETQKGRIQEISIAEEDPDVEKDLTLYARFLIETPEVNQTLIEMHQDLDAFTRQAITKANGNFGYLGAIGRAVDEAIRQEHPDLLKAALDLSQLPNDLQDLYAFFLTKIKSAVDEQAIRVTDPQTGKKYFLEVWSEIYQPILGILSVAQKPLTLEQIQRFGDLPGDWQHLIAAIDRLSQFLDKIENCYRLYHSTLPEFFISPETQVTYSYCYVDSVAQHRGIVNYYQAGALSWAEVNLQKIAEDDYGRQHLAQHLVKADRIEELHALLSLEKDGKNAWFKVKDDEGDTAGFLADVELAWELAEQNWTEATLPQVIEKQCRYALILSSLNSLSDIPDELLEALVKAGLPYGWSLKKGLAHARQSPDAAKRAQGLAILVDYLPDEQQEKIWQEVLAVAESIEDKLSHAQVLSDLAARCPEVFELALSAAQAIQHGDDRAQVLSNLATNFPEVFEQALAAIHEIRDESKRVRILSGLAAKFPEAFDLALAATQESGTELSWDRSKNAQALRDLAPNVPLERFEVFLAAVQETPDEYERAALLSVLAVNFPAAFDQALISAQSIQEKLYLAQVLSALAVNSLEAFDQGLASAQSMQNTSNPTKLLSELDVPPEEFEVFLAAVPLHFMQNSYGYAEVLGSLAVNVPPERFEAFLATVQEIPDEYERAKVLSVLAANFPAVVDQALATVQKVAIGFPEALDPDFYSEQVILIKSKRVEVLSALAVNYPEALEPALVAAQAIQDEYSRAQVLGALAVNALEVFDAALTVIQVIQDEYSRADVLRVLAENVPLEKIEQFLAITQAIKHESYRVEVLKGLAKSLSPEKFESVFTDAQKTQDTSSRVDVLRALAENVPPEKFQALFAAAQKIEDEYSRDAVLIALGSRFPQTFDLALAVAQKIENDYSRALVLSALGAKFPAAFDLAFAATQRISYEPDRVEVLRALVVNTPPEKFESVFIDAQKIQDTSFRVEVLRALVVNTPPEKFELVFIDAQKIEDEYSRALILSALGAKFPAAFDLALATVQAIKGAPDRAKVLEALADNLPIEKYEQFLAAAQYIQWDSLRALVLSALVAKFPAAFDPALAATQRISYEPDRVEVLRALVVNTPPERFEQVLAATQKIEYEISRALVLSDLAANFPAVFEQALAAVQEIRDEYYRTQALINLVAKFPAAFEPALAAAQAIENESHRAGFLRDLAAHSPLAFEQAMATAQKKEDTDSRAEAMKDLILRSLNFPIAQKFSIWQGIIYTGSQRKRPDFLSDLAASVPLIDSLGGKVSRVSVAKVVQQVALWWE